MDRVSADRRRSPDGNGANPPAGGRVPGFLVGRLLGVPVYLSATWVLPAAFITFLYADVFTPAGTTPGVRAHALAFGVAVLVAVSVFVHEASHVVVARMLGLPVRRIVIHLIGGVSEIERQPENPTREYLVAVAGPLSSLFLAGVGFLLTAPLSGDAARYAAVFALVNGLVGVLNLLPGLPLDGGRVLRAGLWRLTGSQPRASWVAAVAGRVLAIAIVLSPFIRTALDPAAASTTQGLDVIWALLIGLYVWGGATVELRVADLRRRLPAVRVRSLARRALPVPGDLPLSEAVRRARDAGARALVTVDPQGRPDGLVSERGVSTTPVERHPWVAVSTLSRPVEPSLVMEADIDGDALLDQMRVTPASEYLVVEPATGEVIGVLATSDVAAILDKSGRSAAPPSPPSPVPPRERALR